MATAWSSFYPLVFAHVSGVPGPLVDTMLRQAARELCENRSWVHDADTVTGDGETLLRSFVLPSESELVRVVRCTVDGEDMTILNSSLSPADYQETEPDDTKLTDTMVVLAGNTQYLLYPIVADGDNIEISMALRPTQTATGVGDIVYTESAEALAHGAIARLCAMASKPWSNPEQAGMSGAIFRAGFNLSGDRVLRQGRMRTKRSPL